MMRRLLHLPGRYYRTIPIDATGYEETEIALGADCTALVVMHCWDIGCEGGPELDPRFCVGMGYPADFREAERIMREVIRPCMDAARAAGVLVAHVEAAEIARKRGGTERKRQVPAAPTPPPSGVVPGWRAHIVARSHGANYATESPYAQMDRARIVEPLPGEPFAHETAQLHQLLQKRGIENLIYTGFATDMCVLRAPGGVEPMAPYGYRLYLMRDATLGVELPDTFEERIATRWGISYFETHYGDTVLSSGFVEACTSVAADHR